MMLGIDIGGSGIKGALVDTKKGELITERYRIKTPKPSKPEAVAEVIKQIMDHFDWKGDVGCTFPSVVTNGKAIYSSNLDDVWAGAQVDEFFGNYCDTNFYVLNDADAAGIAEMKYGAIKGLDGIAILITIGTGLGSAVFHNGVLLPNTELGRIYGKDGKPIETYASDAARKRDDLSIEEWAGRFNFYLNHVKRILSPDHIILGGGMSKKIKKFKKYLDLDVPVIASESENHAGIIGAAVYAEMKSS